MVLNKGYRLEAMNIKIKRKAECCNNLSISGLSRLNSSSTSTSSISDPSPVPSDVKFIVVRKTVFPAHRSLLARKSPVFDLMFFTTFAESAQAFSPRDCPEVYIDDIQPETFQVFLTVRLFYMYLFNGTSTSVRAVTPVTSESISFSPRNLFPRLFVNPGT
jgi:hypothetical protein